jgi:hypothetical protein
MDDGRDELGLPTLVPLRPSAVGRGLPVPPLIPLVGVVCLLVGLGLGYRIAPDHGASAPPPTPSTPEISGPPIQPYVMWPADGILAVPPTMPTASPPATGLSMKQALGALENLGLGSPPAIIVSSSVDQYRNVGVNPAYAQDDWVWVFRVRGDPRFSRMLCTSIDVENTATVSPYVSGSAVPSDDPVPVVCGTVQIEVVVGELIETDALAVGY